MGGAPTSAPATSTSSQNNGETEANVQFLDLTPVKSVTAPTLARYKGPTFSDPSKATDFLTRPVLVYSNTVTAGIAWTLNPLSLYFSVTSVAAKMRNVARLRATINLRVQINGNPFTYGRLSVGYHPYPGIRAVKYFNKTSVSQLTGGLLDPSCNDVLQISIPYHGVNDFWNTDEVRGNPTGTYGELWILDLNALRQFGAVGTPPVPLSVYMWLSDIDAQLSTPVAFAVPEARDEYGQGPVSRMATSVAGVAAGFRDVPVIGLYARATEIGAKAVAGVASLFGWGSPLVLKSRTYVRHDRFPPMPSLVDDTSYKLALDLKQELTVDPTIVAGSDTDDMALSAVWSRPAFVGTFTWAPANVVGDNLMRLPVSPGLVAQHPTAATLWCHTPLSFASALFNNWTGGLVITLELVAARFHTGRLRVSFIPTVGAVVDDLSYTTNNVVIDLAASRTVRIRVPYNSTTPWKKWALRDASLAVVAGDAPYISGVLQVDVVDALYSNLATDLAFINVYVAADEDFAVQVPTTYNVHRYAYTDVLCAGLCAAGAAGLVLDPCAITDVTLFGPAQVPVEVSSVYFGQRYDSIRSLVKAYTPYWIGSFNAGTTFTALYYFAHPLRPLTGNSVTNQPTVTDTFNYWTNYSWFSQGYLGVRGGTRWKLDFHLPTIVATGVSIPPDNVRGGYAGVVPDMTALSTTGVTTAFLTMFACGGVQNAARLAYGIVSSAFQAFGPGELIELDVPSLNTTRFTTGWSSSALTFGAITQNVSGAGSEKCGFFAGIPMTSTSATPTDYPLSVYQAGAEDTSFVWFVCAPVLYAGSPRAT